LTMKNEFDPLITFTNLIQNWWKIVGFAVVLGLAGLGISFLQPAMYQAEAIFHASIDFTQINFENLVDRNDSPLRFTQYDEDLALQIVERMALSRKAAAFTNAQILDPSLDLKTFDENYQIQRYHALWYLRFRHEDPMIAQAIVNFWADETASALSFAQADGIAESFVIIDSVTGATLPHTPIYHNRNTLTLAGTLVGLFLGIMWVDGRIRYQIKQSVEV